MKQQIILFILNVLLYSPITHASAGGENGNGGDAVVCRNTGGSIRSSEQADYYEARVVRGISVELGNTALSWQEKTDVALNRLARLDPSRAENYRKWISEFLKETKFVSGNELPDIPDTGGIVVPAGCKIEQIAIQKEPQFPEDKRYTVNKDIWDAYDNTSKAGLVLHEIIYREALSFFAKNSIGSRYFNSILASPTFETINLTSYIQRLVAAGIYNYNYATKLNGQPFSLKIPLAHSEKDKWVIDVTYVDSWVLFNLEHNRELRRITDKFETAFGTTLTRNFDDFNVVYISVPGSSMNVGNSGFILREKGFETYLLSTGGQVDSYAGTWSFNGKGLIEGEAPVSCSESFFINQASPIYGDQRDLDYIDLHAGGYRCKSADGSYVLEVLSDTTACFLRAQTASMPGADQNDPKYMEYAQFQNLKSMQWNIFGKQYLIKRKPSCGIHAFVSCVHHSNEGFLVDIKKKSLRLAATPEDSCYVLQEIAKAGVTLY